MFSIIIPPIPGLTCLEFIYYLFPGRLPLQTEPLPKKLLDQVRDAVRLKHYSYRTEQTYALWIYRSLLHLSDGDLRLLEAKQLDIVRI